MKFLIITLTGWEEPPRARHQVTMALNALGHEVVFVAKNKVGKFRIEKKNISSHLSIIEPYFPIDYRFRYRLPLINEYYQNRLFSELASAFPNHEVINFDFTAHRLKAYFQRYIYYCNDHYIGNSKYPNILVNIYHEYCERKMTRYADFCVSTACYISERLKKFNQHVFDIPLGGPEIQYDQLPPLKTLNKRKPIIVGLVGFISNRNISYKLVNNILYEKDLKLVIIGPVEDSFLKKIKDPNNNLTLKGTLTHEALFNEINHFDVGIAPYNLKRINPGTTPNKMWQYLALGKPVIVSNLKNINIGLFPEKVLYIANSDNDFIPLIRQAFSDNSAELIDTRINLAKGNTWTRRMEEFIRIHASFYRQNTIT